MSERPIDIEKVKSILLSVAVEDHTGLYEVIWELNSAFPDSFLGEKYRVAELVIHELFSKGYIEFYKWVFTPDHRDYRVESIASENVYKILSNPTAWYPDHNRVRVVFSATKAGEQTYFSGEMLP